MSNEELLDRITQGDEGAVADLCENNCGLIRSRAKRIAGQFSCLSTDSQGWMTANEKETLSELESVGMVAFLECVRSGGYDSVKGSFSTYIVPFLDGAMRRHLESSLGSLSLDRDSMTLVRKAQALHYGEGMSTSEAASILGISPEAAARALAYPTHFLSVYDLRDEEEQDGGDVYDTLEEWEPSPSVEERLLRKLSLEDLAEAFHALPKRDQDIIGRSFGVYGFPKSGLMDIAIRNRIKEDGVEKAKTRVLKLLRKECMDRFAWKLRRAARKVDRA